MNDTAEATASFGGTRYFYTHGFAETLNLDSMNFPANMQVFLMEAGKPPVSTGGSKDKPTPFSGGRRISSVSTGGSTGIKATGIVWPGMGSMSIGSLTVSRLKDETKGVLIAVTEIVL